MAEFETIRYEEVDGVAWVTLDRPEVLHAFDATMCHELETVWRSLRRNDDVKVAVLTASGDRAFCVGIDRSQIDVDYPDKITDGGGGSEVAGFATPFMLDDPGDQLGPKSCDLWKPVIAAVNGVACGGAFYLLGEVDFVIAADHATFFDPHLTYGMPTSFEPIHLAQKMPFHEIMRMSLMGGAERLSAQRAYEVGLVTEVVPGDELAAAATRCAEVIASYDPVAVQATLRAIWSTRELPRSAALANGYSYLAIGQSAEALRAGQERFASGQRQQWRLR